MVKSQFYIKNLSLRRIQTHTHIHIHTHTHTHTNTNICTQAHTYKPISGMHNLP